MKSIGWVTIQSGGGPVILGGDATGPSDNNTVTAIHADGIQYPFGALVEGELLTVSGGSIVAGGVVPTTLSGDANGLFGSNTVDSIHADAVQYPFGALAEGEALVVSGGNIVAGGPIPTTLVGDAQGAFGSNEVRAIHESGNQQLSIGAIPDGGVLTRSGTSIIGVVPQNEPVYRLYGSFTHVDTEVFLEPIGGLPANALVIGYDIAISVPFDDILAVVTMGWFGNPEGLMSASSIKEGAVGTYGERQHVPGAASQAVQLFINAGGSSQGSGTAVVEYILT